MGGFDDLCFFHLLIHALFKSIIFMIVGFILHRVYGTQNKYHLFGVYRINSFFCSRFIVGNLSLSAFFFRSGYYSKDACLEGRFLLLGNIFLDFLLIISIRFTIIYSLKFFLLVNSLSSFIKRYHIKVLNPLLLILGRRFLVYLRFFFLDLIQSYRKIFFFGFFFLIIYGLYSIFFSLNIKKIFFISIFLIYFFFKVNFKFGCKFFNWILHIKEYRVWLVRIFLISFFKTYKRLFCHI